MNESIIVYGFIFMGVMLVLYALGIAVHYERMLRLKDRQIDSLQKDLNSAHAKMMTVDYEKFAEINIRAQAEAMATWREVASVPEFSDTDIHEPKLEKVMSYGP